MATTWRAVSGRIPPIAPRPTSPCSTGADWSRSSSAPNRAASRCRRTSAAATPRGRRCGPRSSTSCRAETPPRLIVRTVGLARANQDHAGQPRLQHPPARLDRGPDRAGLSGAVPRGAASPSTTTDHPSASAQTRSHHRRRSLLPVSKSAPQRVIRGCPYAQLTIPFNEPEIMLYRAGALEVKRYAKPAQFVALRSRPQPSAQGEIDSRSG